MDHLAAAAKLHRALFGTEAPPGLPERFAAAAEALAARFPPEARAEARRALEATGDPEALEYAARVTGRLPALVAEVEALVHLAEAYPEDLDWFVAREPGPGLARVLLGLAAGVARSAWKLGKGLILLGRVPRG